MEEHRITLRLAEGLAGNQLCFGQAVDLELPEQYSTCQVVGLRLYLMLLQMVAVGVELAAAEIAAELAELVVEVVEALTTEEKAI